MHFFFFSLTFLNNNSCQVFLSSCWHFKWGTIKAQDSNRQEIWRQRYSSQLPHRHQVSENIFSSTLNSRSEHQVSSVCLVWGSRRATSPPVSSRADTIRIGTAQFVSTSLPNTRFPVIAATRPTPVKKPRAEDLKEGEEETPPCVKRFGWIYCKQSKTCNQTTMFKADFWSRLTSCWVLGKFTVAESGRAPFPPRPGNSMWSLTPRQRHRTGPDSGLWSGPCRWGRRSGWTTPSCRLGTQQKREATFKDWMCRRDFSLSKWTLFGSGALLYLINPSSNMAAVTAACG